MTNEEAELVRIKKNMRWAANRELPWHPCPSCRGSGSIYYGDPQDESYWLDDLVCDRCNGEGNLVREEQI